jgi:hypothetical protein
MAHNTSAAGSYFVSQQNERLFQNCTFLFQEWEFVEMKTWSRIFLELVFHITFDFKRRPLNLGIVVGPGLRRGCSADSQFKVKRKHDTLRNHYLRIFIDLRGEIVSNIAKVTNRILNEDWQIRRQAQRDSWT